MRKADFYYDEIYLGTLFENGYFNYLITSNYSKYLDIEYVAHTLEIIRESSSSETFNFDNYIDSWNNFTFKDNFHFKITN